MMSMRRILIVTSPGRGHGLHRLPATDALLSRRSVRTGRMAGLGNLATLIPGLFVPSCNSELASTVCVHNVNSHVGAPSIKLCMSGIPCVSGSTFSFGCTSVRHVSMLHKPRKALCKHGAVKKLVHMRAGSPFDCRNASLELDTKACNGCGTSMARCRHVSRRFTFSIKKFCRRTSKFFGGSTGGGGGASHDGTKNKHVHTVCLPARGLGLSLGMGCRCDSRKKCPCFCAKGMSRGRGKGSLHGSGANLVSCGSRDDCCHDLLGTDTGVRCRTRGFALDTMANCRRLGSHVLLSRSFARGGVFALGRRRELGAVSRRVIVGSGTKRG